MRLCSAWACVVSLSHGRQSNEIGLITHFSEVAFLHERLRAAYVAWLPAVPCVDRAGVDAADVRCQEHDVRGISTSTENLVDLLFIRFAALL